MMKNKALLIAALLGAGGFFNSFANVKFDCEETNAWFSVTAASADLSASTWTKPSQGEAAVSGSVIALDTDTDDPLVFTPVEQSSDYAIVKAEISVTASESFPDVGATPQAALTVLVSNTLETVTTNWIGLAGGASGAEWKIFTNVIPVVGETRAISIDFDKTAGKVRYWVGDTVLTESGSADGWYANPATAAQISSVSFSGTGDVGDFSGRNVVEKAAVFNGATYGSFAAALAAAEDSPSPAWSAENPIVLYENATYAATATKTLYVNANGKTFTINGEVVCSQSGNTYAITAKSDCEAIADGATYCPTLAGALEAAASSVALNKNLATAFDLAIDKSLTFAVNGKTYACSSLTVADGKTLTLDGAMSVGNATLTGAVAGDALTVTGTLTGTSVANLTLAGGATFAYAGTALAPATLAIGGAVTVTAATEPAVGTVLLTAPSALMLANFAMALPEGKVLALDATGRSLVVAEEVFATVATSETAGFDFTNGTITATTTVKSGKIGTATLRVIDFATGGVVATYESRTAGGAVSWDVSDKIADDLVPGGTYGYEVAVTVTAGGRDYVTTGYGTFTAANWDSSVWFGADASVPSVTGGAWSNAAPSIVDSRYVIEEESVFELGSGVPEKGTNRVSQVDMKVAFDTLADADVEVDAGAFGGIVAGKDEDENPQWMALSNDGTGAKWVALAGAVPALSTEYTIRAELDFLSATKRIRYLVREGDGAFVPLFNGSAAWLPLAQDRERLDAVTFKGTGSLAKFEAKVSDRAIAQVGDVKYDNLADALAAGGTVKLLTNATVAPTLLGTYTIDANGFQIRIVVPSGMKYTWDPSTGKLVVKRAGSGTVLKFY